MRLGKKDRPHSPFSFHLLASFIPRKLSHSRAEGGEEMAIDHSHWSTPPHISAFLQSCILANLSTNNWVLVQGVQQKEGQDPQAPEPLAGSSAHPELSSAK